MATPTDLRIAGDLTPQLLDEIRAGLGEPGTWDATVVAALLGEIERLRAQAVADEDAENTASCAQDTRIRELEQENAYLKADRPHYVWMLSDDSPFRSDPELFVSSAAAKAAAEADYLTCNYADPASAIAEGDAVLEWVPILHTDAEQLLDGNGRTGLIVMRVQVKGRMDPAETAPKAGA